MVTVRMGAQQPKDAASIDERAKKANESLSALYKQLNEKWEAIQQKLRKMVPPREAWVSYKQIDAFPGPMGMNESEWEVHYCIGLIKYRGEWQICHGVYMDEQESEPGSWKPIVDCSVSERVEAVEHVDKLREEILISAEGSIPEVEKAIAILTTAIKQF